MDISFSCTKCKQHLVIVEAGAGLTIQCPMCGASMVVPKRATSLQPPQIQTTPDKLRNQSRNLAYELRVDDAILALDEAERVRSREKGYQLREDFRFHSSAQGVMEQGKWAIAQSIKNLAEKEEQEILGALIWQELSGNPHRKNCEEMRAVVIGSNLQWPMFDTWFRRFKELDTWPVMWEIVGNDEEGISRADMINLYESELGKPTHPLLAQMHALSLSARRLLFGARMYLTPDALRDGGVELETGMSELRVAGFARRCAPTSIEKRLEYISLKWLQALQKKYEVTVQRARKGEAPKDSFERKQRILQPLIAKIGIEKLAKELPPEPIFELTPPDVPRADFEGFRADILAHTLYAMMATYRDYESMAELDQHPLKISKRLRTKAILTDDCPFCLEASERLDRTANVNLNMLPPFHPGCRCCTSCERDGGER